MEDFRFVVSMKFASRRTVVSCGRWFFGNLPGKSFLVNTSVFSRLCLSLIRNWGYITKLIFFAVHKCSRQQVVLHTKDLDTLEPWISLYHFSGLTILLHHFFSYDFLLGSSPGTVMNWNMKDFGEIYVLNLTLYIETEWFYAFVVYRK